MISTGSYSSNVFVQSFGHYKYLYTWWGVHICSFQNRMEIKTLIERAKANDMHALETLYMMYYPKMLGLCIKITKEDEDSAKDLVHDAFVLAFSHLHNLNTPERFGEWLSTITRNVVLKYMERKNKVNYVSMTEEDNIIDTNSMPDLMVNRQDILNLIDELPIGYAKVFRLYAIEGFSHKEIADILGIKPHSSSSQLARAKAMLQKMMDYRGLTVVLFLIMTISLYLFILREKPLQQNTPKTAKDSGRRNPAVANESPQILEDRIAPPQLQVYRKKVTPDVYHTQQDTTQSSDTIIVGTFVPDAKVVEQKQDSTEQVDSMKRRFTFPAGELLAQREKVKHKSSKWHILVTGSLSPVLAQNRNILIATGKPDLDSEWPTFPDNVKTWEDYSRFLHMIEHANTPEDSLVLMEIADHNKGDIVEREHHDRPITFGISLNRSLSERWSFEVGMQYSVLKSRSMMGNKDYNVSKEQSVHYLGIPIRMSYRLADYRRLSVYGSAGLSLNIPVYGKVDSTYIVANMQAYVESWKVSPPVQWSTSFSLGAQYRLLSKWMLYVEPTLYWHIPNGSATHTVWTERPIMFSTSFGIRFTW